MSIHVLVPLTDSFEGLVLAVAVDVVAVHLIVFVARRRSCPSYGALHSVEFGVDQARWDVLLVRHGDLQRLDLW